jgi:enoyl-CoA hydratase
MEYKNVKFDPTGNIGILTINRPKVLNALNTETIAEIRSVLTAVRENDGLKVLIITGEGQKAFVAGADIGEINQLGLKDGFDFLKIGHQMNHEIETLGKPTIAAINGLALGGGCELALSCTLRVVSETAKLGLPELGLGVIPGYGGTQRLTRLIGKSRALWCLLTGDLIDAHQAIDMGLAGVVTSPDDLIPKTMGVAKKISTKAPLAVKMALYAVKYGAEMNTEAGLVLENALANITLASEDKKEGISAFLEKRKPVFKGE